MISRVELRKIARAHLKDAKALLSTRRYEGAFHVGGYAVEIALKSRICKTLKWSEFPETPGEFRNYQSFKTHNLDVLLSLSGVEAKIKAKYLAEWSAFATWDPEVRYKPPGSVSQAVAELLVSAAEILLRVL